MASTARLDELKKKFDENPRRYFAPLANEHRKSGNLDQAITLCQAHLPQQPAHISGHIVLGQALFEAGQVDESRDTFQTALELDPENLIALRYLGDIARTGGDMDAARAWYHRVLEVDPRNDEIEQLIRELDAPAAADPAENLGATAPAQALMDLSGAEPPSETPPRVDHSRFEPLTIDQIDTDTELFAPSTNAGLSDSANAHPAELLDSQAGWTDATTDDLPLLDLPELDPYATPANAGAETLLRHDETVGETLKHDPSLDQQAVSADAVDFGNLEASTEPASNRLAGSEGVRSAASPSEPLSEFDDNAFYIEPAPSVPAASPPADEWSASRAAPESTSETSRPEELAPLSSAGASDDVTLEERADHWENAPSAPPSAAAPNADEFHLAGEEPATTLEHTAPDTIESSPALSARAEAPADDALGLEVMEFVPPARSEYARIDAPTMADPLVGHMPELATPPTAGATPDAFVTETMAELYLQQGFTSEALAVYRELLARNPEDASLRERIEQIESGSMSSIGMAMVSENVVESARKRQTERPARSVRSFFASLAGRRAPYPTHREPDQPAHESEDTAPTVDASPSDWGMEASMDAEAESQPDAQQMIPGASDDAIFPDSRASVAPSAAEQMAEFDPFADAEPARPTPRSLEDIFPDDATSPRSDSSAQPFATAFGRSEPQGRPTRAASNELSLDRVFRGTPEGPPPTDGGFSFDQFFSDTRTAGSDASATPQAPNASEASRSGEAGSDAHDIEQFTAWLEGLKKK